ncbi:hypothetical protein Q1695_005357 [Nippostrongylus brasiliensis]|nr:hypothetical protein Q1695_005357 [Nippostrongylus brasiliensis]
MRCELFLMILTIASYCQPDREGKACMPWVKNYVSGLCYRMMCGKMSWDQAHDLCESEFNATLPIICDEEENDFLGLLVRGDIFGNFACEETWLGLKRDNKTEEHVFHWDNGAECNYKAWAEGEPNNHNKKEHCGEFRHRFAGHRNRWNDNSDVLMMIADSVIISSNVVKAHWMVRIISYAASTSLCVHGNMHWLLLFMIVSSPNNRWFVTCNHDMRCFPWVKNHKSGQCYTSVCTRMSRDNAKKHCESMNATMPIIHSKEENDFISLLIRSGPGERVQRSTLWIGLKRDRSQRGLYFAWDNGDARNFNGWARGEPNDWGGREDCVEYREQHHGYYHVWNDVPCDWQLYTFCQKPCEAVEYSRR